MMTIDYKKSLTACFMLALTGCATMCDRQCNLEKSARAMTTSSDVGIRASAVKTLEDMHPEIKNAVNNVREKVVSKTLECSVKSVEESNGHKTIKMTNCTNPQPPAGP